MNGRGHSGSTDDRRDPAVGTAAAVSSRRRAGALRRFLAALFPWKNWSADPKLRTFQQIIRYNFRDDSLLEHALTHKSFPGQDDVNGLLSNERLEFLGDSVVNCLVTDYLYRTYPDKSEGHLSKIKSLVVSRKILGEIANELDTGVYLIMSQSEENTGGRARQSTMSNAFEAIVGAMYLDGGLKAVRIFLERFLFDRIAGFWEDESNVNYKSKILEMAQKDGLGIPRYVTAEATGPDHAKQFKVKIIIDGVEMGEGTGPSKKAAQQMAAQNAVADYGKMRDDDDAFDPGSRRTRGGVLPARPTKRGRVHRL